MSKAGGSFAVDHAVGLSKPDSPTQFPDTFLDPQIKKQKAYCMQTTKAIYYQSWASWSNPYGNVDRQRWIDTALFCNGQFNIQAFMGGKKDVNDTEKNPWLKELDFDPVTELPKIMDIFVGYMEQIKYRVTATTINPAGMAEKENIRLNAMADIHQADFNNQVNQMAGAQITSPPKFPFKTVDELNLYFQLGGYKSDAELQIELGTEIVKNDSDYKNHIYKMILEDSFKNGRMVCDTEIDNTGRQRYIYVDPINCGVEDYRGHFLAKPAQIWYTTLMTIQDLIIDSSSSPNPLTTTEAMEIAQRYQNKYDNPTWASQTGVAQQHINTDNQIGFFWYQWKVPVIKTYWEEVDVYKTVTETKHGKKFTKPAPHSAKTEVYYDTSKGGRPPRPGEKYDPANTDFAPQMTREVSETYVHKYYQSKWVPGSEYIWNYGPVPFQTRDPFDIKRSLCPLKYYRITNSPKGEMIKPFVKKEFNAWLKLDQEVANAKAAGYIINLAAFENIAIGQNKTFKVEDAFAVWNQTGNVIIRDQALADEYGVTKGKIPLIPIDQRGFMEAMQRWIALIQYYQQRIADVSGINSAMDATSPNPTASAQAVKAALQGSKNSMSQYLSAALNMGEKLALDTSGRLQLLIKKFGPYNGYVNAIGSGLMKAASVGEEVLNYTYGINVHTTLSEESKTELKQAIMQATTNATDPTQGGIFMPDALEFQQMVDDDVNPKIIRLVMAQRQKQNLQTMNQQTAASQQAQGQQNLQVAQATKQGEMDAYAHKRAIDLQFEQGLTKEIQMRQSSDASNRAHNKLITDNNKSILHIQQKQAEAALPE